MRATRIEITTIEMGKWQLTEQFEAQSWRQWPDGKPSYSTPAGRPSAKWRGQTVSTGIRAIQTTLSDADRGLRAFQKLRAEAQRDLRAKVEELLSLTVILGERHCGESPTLECIYEDTVDYSPYDSPCLFCGLFAKD